MIKDAHAVRDLLTRLVNERSSLSVFFSGGGERYGSLLLGFDEKLGALLADELHPDTGHARVACGQILRWVGRLDGVDLRFRSRIRAIDGDGGVAAYLIEIPTALDHRERRKAYRVRVPASETLRADLTQADLQPVAARVADISIDGVGLAVPSPHALRIRNRWTCVLRLPGGGVETMLSVRHVHPPSVYGEPDRIGARFVELSEPAKRRIGRYATSIQRDRLRDRSRSRADTGA